MSTKNIGRALLGTLLGALLLVAVPATFAAAPEAGQWSLGFYGGTYAPGPDDAFDDQNTFGLRVGRMITDRYGVGLSIGTVDPDYKALENAALTGVLDVENTLVDLGVFVAFRPKSRFNLFLGGGIGGAFISSSGQVTGPPGTVFYDDLTKDSATVHVGTGMIIGLSKKVFLRPMMKLRYFEAREDDEVDQEVSLGVGFKF